MRPQTLKKVSLELGGKNPQIVFPDADLEAAVDAAVFGAYFNAGECCNAGSRLIVHQDIADDVHRQRVAERSGKVTVGDPLDRRTQVGAIITPEHLDKIDGYVARRGRRRRHDRSGRRTRSTSAPASIMAPTIVCRRHRRHGDRARRGVRPGAVGADLRNRSTRPSRIANAVDYGLSAGVWSRDYRHLPDRRPARPRRHRLDEHLHGRRSRAALRRLQAVRHRAASSARHAVEDYTEDEDAQHALRPAHRLVDADRDWPESGWPKCPRSGKGCADRSGDGIRFATPWEVLVRNC